MARGALSIRPGTRRDAATIVGLLRGLAEYERLLHECAITAAAVRRHGFGGRPYFRTLICRRHDRPIGLAVYYFTYSTFRARPTLYLEDLFVLPDERGRGAGLALLRALARIAVGRGCGRMEWTVLDWNRPAQRFYRRLGAGLRRQWILTELSGPPLARLAAPAKTSARSPAGRGRRASQPRTPTAGESRRRSPGRGPRLARRSGAGARSRRRA